MPNLPPATDDQVSEHIPWEQLTIPPQPDRKVLVYGIAAGLIVVVLGVVVFRQINRPSAPDLVPVTPIAVASEPLATTTTLPPVADQGPVPATVALAEPEVTPGLSQADLMAVDREGTERALAGTAEWLVLEFFTIDPSEVWAERVQAASGLRLPHGVAPEPSSADTVSYVEWTRTRSVTQTGPDTYRALVLIRRLVAPDGTGFRRLPVERVEVDLRVEVDGGVRALSLPEISAPTETDLVPLPESELAWRVDSAGIGWPVTR
ncbi:MAG: hypothetical protein OXM57_03690 [bacterium]|nr:hypothetical protein [bacterium]MDE0351772.1 hypothetical protein [bacterium]